MPLDFSRAVALFMGTEQELARALGISLGDLRSYRTDPHRIPSGVVEKLGHVLIERGRGMQRVGELLAHDHDA